MANFGHIDQKSSNIVLSQCLQPVPSPRPLSLSIVLGHLSSLIVLANCLYPLPSPIILGHLSSPTIVFANCLRPLSTPIVLTNCLRPLSSSIVFAHYLRPFASPIVLGHLSSPIVFPPLSQSWFLTYVFFFTAIAPTIFSAILLIHCFQQLSQLHSHMSQTICPHPLSSPFVLAHCPQSWFSTNVFYCLSRLLPSTMFSATVFSHCP